MEWTALRDFVAVSNAGSLSGAARVIGVSQPTIGRRIEQLEQQLDAILFNRTPQGLTLTQTGEQILAYAKRMSDEAMIIERIASGANQRLEGSVRVTLSDTMSDKWLPSKLPEFFQRYPGLHLEVCVENRELDLVRREADIGFRLARPSQLDLVARRTISFHYGLYGSNDYLERYGHPKTIRDFREHYFVGYDETYYTSRNLKRLEKLFGLDRILTRSTSGSGILATVSEGVGLGITSCYFANQLPNLERILPDSFDFRFDGWLVTHADIYKSVRIKTVFDFLIEKLEEDTAKFAGKDI